jgi:hypothetical protein
MKQAFFYNFHNYVIKILSGNIWTRNILFRHDDDDDDDDDDK